jgi:predicted  nucleic acid-binding Zn-ribbon protein
MASEDELKGYKAQIASLEKEVQNLKVMNASNDIGLEEDLKAAKSKISRYEEANKILGQEVQVIRESYAQLKQQNQELLSKLQSE